MPLTAPYIPNRPLTKNDPNGIAHSTTKADRVNAKAAWVTWSEQWKDFTAGQAADPGPFDYAGFTYADE